MYKSQCSKCKRIFETEIKYYNYICEECTQKQKENQKKTDLYLLEQYGKELERVKATGDEEMIKRMTELYNQFKAQFEKKYGST